MIQAQHILLSLTVNTDWLKLIMKRDLLPYFGLPLYLLATTATS